MKTKRRYKFYFLKETADTLGISTVICRNDLAPHNFKHAHKVVDRRTGRLLKGKERHGQTQVKYASLQELK